MEAPTHVPGNAISAVEQPHIPRQLALDRMCEEPGGTTISVVATQTLAPGQRQTVAAYEHLRTAAPPRGPGRRDLQGAARIHRLGEAVIRDEDNRQRPWLHLVHDKIPAVDRESAGLAHAFHEDRDADSPRGAIDAHHASASHNAAHTFAALLPYLI